VIGVGSLGNIAGSAPMAWAVEAFGWRETMFGLALVSAAIAVAVWFSVNDPERVETDAKGSVFDLLKIPALWFIFPMMFVNYAPAAGLRGLWIGPYMSDIFGADAARIGTATLVMALAMVVGNFVYGPLDRIFGTRKWVIFVGNAIGVTACFALWSFDNSSIWTATLWFAAVGFCGGSFPVMIAHSKTFFPAHLTGRGVTLLNLFGIGGAGLMQVITGRIYAAKLSESGSPAVAYDTLFLFFGLLVCAGLAIYAFSQDRMD
jgi:predicted MFS family arabinose efflux permease